jgi:hypothetical protein
LRLEETHIPNILAFFLISFLTSGPCLTLPQKKSPGLRQTPTTAHGCAPSCFQYNSFGKSKKNVSRHKLRPSGKRAPPPVRFGVLRPVRSASVLVTSPENQRNHLGARVPQLPSLGPTPFVEETEFPICGTAENGIYRRQSQ